MTEQERKLIDEVDNEIYQMRSFTSYESASILKTYLKRWEIRINTIIKQGPDKD